MLGTRHNIDHLRSKLPPNTPACSRSLASGHLGLPGPKMAVSTLFLHLRAAQPLSAFHKDHSQQQDIPLKSPGFSTTLVELALPLPGDLGMWESPTKVEVGRPESGLGLTSFLQRLIPQCQCFWQMPSDLRFLPELCPQITKSSSPLCHVGMFIY